MNYRRNIIIVLIIAAAAIDTSARASEQRYSKRFRPFRSVADSLHRGHGHHDVAAMHRGGVHAGANTSLVVNVLDFGARGDACAAVKNGAAANNATDNTAPFTAALAECAKAGGGTVYAPPGCYAFQGALSVPTGVCLRGSYTVVPSHDMRDGGAGQEPTDGTVLMPLADRGNANGTSFVTLPLNAGLAGLVVFYPQQERVATPVPYPYAVSMTADNAFVTDVELLNPWGGINAVGAHRHYIARVQGQPLNVGVRVDATYDIGRIEDVHFNPWYSCAHPFVEWQLTHGRAFVMGRSDWEYVFNTFAFGYAIGYHFIETSTGTMNGNFLGIGADLAINASVRVDASQAPGLLITNGEFTAFHTAQWLPHATSAWESTQIVVGPDNKGPVKLVDTSFWGPCSQVVQVAAGSTGSLTLSACQLVQWDLQAKDGRAAVQIGGGSAVLIGNTFADNKTQVEVGPGAKKVVVVANLWADGEMIVDNSGGKAAIEKGLNA